MHSTATFFEFTSYEYEPDKKRILFNYKTEFSDRGPILFTETITLPTAPNMNVVGKELFNKLLASLHMILGISYFKFYCATKVTVPYQLSKKEADFWNTVYKKGLGEFFYKNNLDPNILPKFRATSKLAANNLPETGSQKPEARILLGIGGGKDSIVAAELLKADGADITAFFVKTNIDSALTQKIVQTLGIESLAIERHLDPKVFDKHLYNGHIPISAIYGFLGVFLAILYGYSRVVVGNEHSSNFGNMRYKGLEINHQWSKSFEFEELFADYVKNILTPSVTYFSLLRPFYEIRIVKMFSHYKQYFPYFSSCNRNFVAADLRRYRLPAIGRGFTRNIWCGECPKCVFVFTLLSAFLPKKELVKIFGKNLYQQEHLLPLFKDVLGLGTMKPFDCVGTFKEAQTALYLAKNKFKDGFIMRQLGKKAKYHPEVFYTNKENNIPEDLKFLGMEKVLIAGFGKEGNVSKKYLKKRYPKLKVGIADSKQGRDYLKKQIGFDFVIKTPGIKKELITTPYTTATNIFFSQVKGMYLTIGITGSKGKSTTSTLIFEILKSAGKEVVFLGNIGQPMLQALLKPIKRNTIFVLELSSYQLDDVAFSPDIAVVTSLFPEHLDYHGTVGKYYEAKKNIINHHAKDNFFVYNQKNKEVKSWLKNYAGRAIPFARHIPLEKNKISLLGEHNQDNIKAAIAAIKILGVSDAAIKKAIREFKPLPHRLELVGVYKGISFYDDAISTTPESTVMALKSIPKVDTIFLGGTDRGYDFSHLEKSLKQYNIKNVVLFPESGRRIKVPIGIRVLKTKSMKEAVAFAYKNTAPGQVCLLSCASPSYSLWKNFEEKGGQFKFFVKKFANSKS